MIAQETGKISAHEFASGSVGDMNLQTTPDEFLTSFRSWPTSLTPDETPFRIAIQALSVPGQEMLFLDDSRTNVGTAQSLGMPAHGVTGAGEALDVATQYDLNCELHR